MFHYLKSILSGYFTPSAVSGPYFVAIFIKSPIKCLNYSQFPFPGSIMGRSLIVAEISKRGHKVNVATSHLESTKDFAAERKTQLGLALQKLISPSCGVPLPWIFGLDTNISKIDEKRDKITLPDGVLDAWVHLGEQPEHQFTWDTSVNKNLRAPFNSKL